MGVYRDDRTPRNVKGFLPFWFKVADSSRGHSLIKFRLSSAAQQKSSGFGFKVYRPPGVEVRNIYGSFR